MPHRLDTGIKLNAVIPKDVFVGPQKISSSSKEQQVYFKPVLKGGEGRLFALSVGMLINENKELLRLGRISLCCSPVSIMALCFGFCVSLTLYYLSGI